MIGWELKVTGSWLVYLALYAAVVVFVVVVDIA